LYEQIETTVSQIPDFDNKADDLLAWDETYEGIDEELDYQQDRLVLLDWLEDTENEIETDIFNLSRVDDENTVSRVRRLFPLLITTQNSIYQR
jgi:hypothetical protein